MLSIMITYYKKEKYIFNCLESIFTDRCVQEYHDKVQVGLVIDGDLSFSKIEDDIRNNFPLVEIYKVEKNLGLFEIRKKCLDFVKYENVWFVDADDSINDVSNLFDKIETTDFKLITFNHNSRFREPIQLRANDEVFKQLSSEEFNTFFLEAEQLYCIRIWKTEYLKKTYEILEKYEIKGSRNLDDFLILPIYILTINYEKIYYLDEDIYNYEVYPDSLSTCNSNASFYQTLDMLISRIPFMDEFEGSNKLDILNSLAKIYSFWFDMHVLNLKKCIFNKELRDDYRW